MKARIARPEILRLCLYVAADSPNSVLAKTHVQEAIAHLSKEEVTLEIIDVLRDPERALSDRVSVTPMLVKLAPAPERRVVGNLRDRRMLFMVLGIREPNGD